MQSRRWPARATSAWRLSSWVCFWSVLLAPHLGGHEVLGFRFRLGRDRLFGEPGERGLQLRYLRQLLVREVRFLVWVGLQVEQFDRLLPVLLGRAAVWVFGAVPDDQLPILRAASPGGRGAVEEDRVVRGRLAMR